MHKYVYTLLSIIILSCGFVNSVFARVDVLKSRNGTVLKVNIDQLKFSELTREGKKFTKIKLQGVEKYNGIIYELGKPEIPVVRFVVASSDPIIVASSSQEVFLPKREVPIYPLQPSLPKIRGAKAPFTMDVKAYTKNNFYPTKAYEVQNLGTVRGVQQKLVTLYPVAYNASTGNLQFRSNFEVRLPRGNLASDFTKSSGANGSTKEGIVFVVGEQFANSSSLAKYIAFKKSIGFDVQVLNIASTTNTPDMIRAKLKEIYASSSFHLDYVVLVGDAEDIPGYPSHNISGTTDLYYSALDTENYENDILTPDVGVGRFSASNEQELQAMVDKSIAYYQGIFANEHWLTQASFLATDDRYEVAEGSHNYAIDKYTAPIGYTGIFPNANQPGGDKLYAISYKVPNATVQQAIQAGRTIIDYSGHGSETYWVAPSVNQNDVRALNSDSALPFVISNACVTGDFRTPESFAETWNRHRYGAILFWGSMDSTYWDEDDILERRMFDGIYTGNKSNFRDITHHALTETATFYGGAGRSKYYWETYTMFGDPSIHLRTTTTQTATVEGLTTVPVGLSPLEYFVKDEQGKPIANARVSILATNNTYIDSFLTDAAGKFSYIPDSSIPAGTEFKILVTGKNIRQSEIGLLFISPDSPYLNAQAFVINGRSEMLAAANEEVAMGMMIKNIGKLDTQGAMLGIESVDGPATVIAGSVGLSAIPSNQVYNVDPSLFRIRIEPNAHRGDVITVRFVWTTNEGSTGRFAKTIMVAKANLETASVDFGDVVSGGIRPGTSGASFFTVKNTGNEPLVNAQLFPKNGTCVDSGSGVLEIAQLLPGESKRIEVPVELRISSSCHNGDPADISFVGNYQGIGGLTPITLTAKFQVGVIALQEVASTSIGLQIPDNGATVEHSLEVSHPGILQDISVHVKITHSYIGDIVLKLVHPDGTEITLRENEGGLANDLDITYGMDGQTVADLKNLVGKPMQGVWRIRVQDTASSDIGTLDSVRMVLKGFIE